LRACCVTQAAVGWAVQPATSSPAGADLDEEQRVHGEKVAGEELLPMLREEGAPGGLPAAWRGRQALPTQDPLDRGR
jgi:hypothetical protein